MVAHEARKRRQRGQNNYAWFMSVNVVPPTDVPTDDEFADTPGSNEFRGQRVVRRKLRDQRDHETVLSKFYRTTLMSANYEPVVNCILGSWPAGGERLNQAFWSAQFNSSNWMAHFVVITRVSNFMSANL